MINIDNLISEATKSRNPALGIYRLIKAEFLRWTKDNPGKDFDASVEAKILKKMYDQRKESLAIYEKAGREDLAKIEEFEANTISEFLPKETPVEEIIIYTENVINSLFNGQVSMKDMKTVLAKVQEKYPNAPGKVVSGVVKSFC